jgi:hypothetical protein
MNGEESIVRRLMNIRDNHNDSEEEKMRSHFGGSNVTAFTGPFMERIESIEIYSTSMALRPRQGAAVVVMPS